MNREIKFRVWSKVKKTWVHNEMLLACIDGLPFAHFVEVNEDKSVIHHVVNASGLDVVIQQYTGLKDKNGVDIYEGDIVKFHEPKELCEDYFMSCLYLFDFHEGSFTNPLVYNSINGSKFVKREPMLPLTTGRAKLDGNSFFDFKTAEIVGNIFKNPELLNE